MTADEAARYLKVKPRTLLQYARQGTVKGYVLSGTERITWRFLQSDLDAAMKPCTVTGTVNTMRPPSVALGKGQVQ
jgi:excisionase family DNA binding protein